MRLTTKHETSCFGVPVFVNSDNELIGSANAICALRIKLSLSRYAFGRSVGASDRTVEGWELGRRIDEQFIHRIKFTYFGRGK